MDKSITKIIITVMIVYIVLLVGSVCLLMHGGKLMIESKEKSDQIDRYKGYGDGNENRKPFSLSPADWNLCSKVIDTY